jgi:uroporphyrinogen decarboxylase
METSKDRVLKAIDHIQPDVTPVHVMGYEGIERWLDHFGAKDSMDLAGKLGLDLLGSPRPVYTGPNTANDLTIWGSATNTGTLTGAGYSEARGGYPLAGATSVADVERLAWPDPDDFDYEVVAQVLRTLPDSKARSIVTAYAVEKKGLSREAVSRAQAFWLPVLCSLFDLFGLEETLVGLHAMPEVIEAAVDHVGTFLVEFSQRLLEATRGLADVYVIGDDFATQRGMLLSPRHWRRFLKPTYQKLFDLTKSYGLKVWFHCCGTFRPVLPDLVDMGIDVWETVQVHLPGNDPQELKREYGRDIAFFGAVSTQQTLPYGTPEDVRAEVRERIRVLGEGGGYICAGDHTILPDVPIENVLAMIDEARSYQP